MPNKILNRNIFLEEFVWDILYNITPEQRKKLSNPYLKILKSAVKTKAFCQFSTTDEKIRLFSELDYHFAIVFFQDKIRSVNSLKAILEKYEGNRQASASKEVSELGVFVSSDKQVKWLLSMMADSIHSKSYFLNLDYNKVGYHIKGWEKSRETEDSRQLKDTIDNLDLLAKTFLNTIATLDTIQGLIGLNANDIRVLLLLYQYRHTHLEKERIWNFFTAGLTKSKCTTILKRLFLNEYIAKHIDYSVPQYTITGKGIEAVSAFMQRILKQNSF